MTHRLILLRHAKSDWSGDHADVDRPLAKRGLRQAPEAGQWLAGHAGEIELALVSPAERARHTWELASAEIGAVPMQRDDRLYTFSAHDLLAVVRTLPEPVGTAALVGHNPGLEDLASHLTGEYVELPTSAIAVIELAGRWADADDDARLLTAGRPPGPRSRT